MDEINLKVCHKIRAVLCDDTGGSDIKLERRNLICLRQEVAMLGCPTDKALICRLMWSVS